MRLVRTALWLAWREVVELRAALVAAALTALLPFVVPLSRGLGGEDLHTAWKWTAMLSAGALTLTIGGVTGARLFDAWPSGRRLGFFLVRPASAAATWTGRIAGATAVLLACLVVTLAPTWWAVGLEDGAWTFAVDIEFGRIPRTWADLLRNLGFRSVLVVDAVALVVVVAVIPSAHVLSLAVRSRGLWLVLDIAVAAAVGAGWFAMDQTLYSFDDNLMSLWPLVAAGSLLASAYAGSAAAVISGRISVARARRLASVTLWMVWLLGLLTGIVWLEWMRHPRIEDITRVHAVATAPSGGWVALYSRARGARVTLLYDTISGREVRVGHSEASLPVLSNDGRTAVWSEREGRQHRLMIVDLTRPRPVPSRSQLLFEDSVDYARFSPSDRLLAVARAGVISVVDLDEDRILHETRVAAERSYIPAFQFFDDDHLRMYVRHPAGRGSFRVAIWSLEVSTGELRRIGDTEALRCAGSLLVLHGPDGERLLAYGGRFGGTVLLLDADDGSTLATLPIAGSSHQVTAGYLHDGRVVLRVDDGADTTLRVLTSSGSPAGALSIPSTDIFLGCEVRPGQLAIAVAASAGHRWDDPTLMLADVDTGEVRTVARGLAPACRLSRNRWTDWSARPAPGAPATSLYYGRERKTLVRFDPETGEREVLVGGD